MQTITHAASGLVFALSQGTSEGGEPTLTLVARTAEEFGRDLILTVLADCPEAELQTLLGDVVEAGRRDAAWQKERNADWGSVADRERTRTREESRAREARQRDSW